MKTRSLRIVCAFLLALVTLVVPVMAGTSGTATITGNPTAVLSLQVLGGITGWNLTPGETAMDNTHVFVNVTSNNSGWTLTAQDARDYGKPATLDGRMVKWDGSVYVPLVSLASPMKITGGSGKGFTGYQITLSNTPATIEAGDPPMYLGDGAGIHNNTVTIEQPVAYTDPIITDGTYYRIIVTFVVAAS